MQPRDASLRDELTAAAAGAAPPGFTAETLVGRVRRRRRRRAVVRAVAGVAAVVLAVAAAGIVRGARDGGTTVAEPPITKPSIPASATGPQLPVPEVFMCGQPLVPADAAGTRSGLTMALDPVRRTATGTGPDLTVTFTATAALHVVSSPPRLFEVLYLKDGVIVGGGPMLNQPGDTTAQGLDLIGYTFDVGPGQPASLELGPRVTLCPAATWPQVWASPQSYEVVVLQGPVETIAGQTSLGVPSPGVPLLIARASLA
ncbi:hypothetical protein ACFPIJ_05625 [Dactylosporangium cerinum]|uniref:Uncharacterized protein n=1 Tax=Dactylosporangium cerinum TaxID=1434730 RepID=A0ABV9VLX2_9ACTN